MPYKHLADKVDYVLYWENDKNERFGGDFNPRHSRWSMCFSKTIDIAPGELETIKLKYKDCIFRVQEHSERFDRTIGDWVKCEPFLRVDIDADVQIPSKIEGQKIAPHEGNSKLLEILFWKVLEITKQVEGFSNEEVKKINSPLV